MPLLKILTIPDPILKTISNEVGFIDETIINHVNNMHDTMLHHKNCVGIAAIQVAIPLRICLVDVSLAAKPHQNNGYLVLINPKIIKESGKANSREGCLSVPELLGNVTRKKNITVEALGLDSKPYTVTTSGFEAIVIQHEIDHLDGILFLDKISSMNTDVFRRDRFLDNKE